MWSFIGLCNILHRPGRRSYIPVYVARQESVNFADLVSLDLCNSDFEHSGHLETCAAKIMCRLDSTLVCKTELLMPIHHKNWKFGVVYRCRSWSIFARHRSCICLGMCNPNSQAMLWLCLHRPDSVADRYCSLNKNPLGSWVMSNSAIDTSSGVVFLKERRTRRHMQTNQ